MHTMAQRMADAGFVEADVDAGRGRGGARCDQGRGESGRISIRQSGQGEPSLVTYSASPSGW